MKTGFAGDWKTSWICVSGHVLQYTSTDIDEFQTMEELNLKKITNITLVKDVKNLQAPQSFPVLVIDYVDRSLYLMPVCEKECSFLQSSIEIELFNNGDTLEEQQLTKDDIPVLVDKCIKFVYGQGCLTEGIYRISGKNKNIETLLEEFRKIIVIRITMKIQNGPNGFGCLPFQPFCLASLGSIHFCLLCSSLS